MFSTIVSRNSLSPANSCSTSCSRGGRLSSRNWLRRSLASGGFVVADGLGPLAAWHRRGFGWKRPTGHAPGSLNRDRQRGWPGCRVPACGEAGSEFEHAAPHLRQIQSKHPRQARQQQFEADAISDFSRGTWASTRRMLSSAELARCVSCARSIPRVSNWILCSRASGA